MKRVGRIGLAVVALGLLSHVTSGQNNNARKFDAAIGRSQLSADVIAKILALTSGEIPKEVIDKSQAVVVFPNVTTQKILMEKTFKGRGVVSIRQADRWSVPVYYNFVGGGFNLTSIGRESTNVVLLLMDKDAIGWLQQNNKVYLSGEKTPLAGPLEPATTEQKNRATYTHVISYTFTDGELAGKTLESTLMTGFALSPDNYINQQIYHLKARQILTGTKIDRASLPNEIFAFQETLDKLRPVH
jgi:lipid-binding SYLF domain-containing protein